MKILYALLLFLFVPVFALAEVIPETLYAVTPYHISNRTVNYGDSISLYIISEDFDTNQKLNIKTNEEIKVQIKSYEKAKRGKRNGYFNVEFQNDKISMYGKMKAATPKDMKSLAQKAGITIAGQILKIPGFSQAIAVSKGLISPNESESRLKSAGKNLYESTPLTYVEKGKDFDVEADGIVVLKLKTNEDCEE